jgi:serine/threonine protein kinase/dipeptidyl aminopeptidase/acylaminoacyl peptidase
MDADRWYRAAEIFEAALDQPESQQADYIRQACAGDAALWREVEELRDENGRGSVLDVPLTAAAIAQLTTPSRIGAYQIEALLGVGGMGEVYRAHDLRLGRQVAIKILPPLFARDTERVARFAREAQVLAALNHSNIAAIFGCEPPLASTSPSAEQPLPGPQALVLELVEGPTLAERLVPGPLSVEESLAIAGQIADALAAAHDAGIVHRDLKPANVKVRADGTVKVLDFGLAKIIEPGRTGVSAGAESPLVTTPAQRAAGLMLGTAAYMSPEQAKGKPADRRSDIWAFGCVLYEMLAGVRAFPGDDVSDTIAAVLTARPDWNALPADTPATVRRVLHRCLEREPGRRYQAISDAKLDLLEREAVLTAAPPRGVGRSRERVAWIVVIAALAAGLGYVATRTSSVRAPVVRFSIEPPEGGQFGSIGGTTGSNSGATVSPDGTKLAFTATDTSGRSGLWLRPLDAAAPRLIPGTDDAYFPFWSPDGRWLGFFAGGKLKRVDVVTGATRVIADAAPGRGASWGARDVIVFGYGNPTRLARVAPDGSGFADVATDNGPVDVRRQPLWPQFLPDGRHFIYFSVHDDPQLMVGSIEAGFTPRVLVRSDTAGLVTRSGFLFFARDRVLLQQRLDLNRLEVVGEPAPLNEDVLFNLEAGLADFAVSPAGVLVYQSERGGRNQFAWVDRTGSQVATVGAPGRYRTFALSPDERHLVYDDLTTTDLWILDLERRTSSRLTTTPGYETSPVWIDDTRVAYRKNTGIFEKNVSGTSDERRVSDLMVNGPTQVTTDGTLLFFFVPPGKTAQGVAALPLTGNAPPRMLVQSEFANVEPYLSPDGRWLAYASSETGRNEVYVQPYPPTGERWQVSSDGGRQPIWRADGRELYFVGDDRRFYAVAVSPTEAPPGWSVPRFLFTMRANVFNTRNSYVPSRDGQRFLINMLAEDSGGSLHVVVNWAPR